MDPIELIGWREFKENHGGEGRQAAAMAAAEVANAVYRVGAAQGGGQLKEEDAIQAKDVILRERLSRMPVRRMDNDDIAGRMFAAFGRPG